MNCQRGNREILLWGESKEKVNQERLIVVSESLRGNVGAAASAA